MATNIVIAKGNSISSRIGSLCKLMNIENVFVLCGGESDYEY